MTKEVRKNMALFFENSFTSNSNYLKDLDNYKSLKTDFEGINNPDLLIKICEINDIYQKMEEDILKLKKIITILNDDSITLNDIKDITKYL